MRKIRRFRCGACGTFCDRNGYCRLCGYYSNHIEEIVYDSSKQTITGEKDENI